MKNNKYWHNYFIYLSVLFLIFTLHKESYLKIPEILSINIFILSLLCLYCGFILNAVAQQKLLAKSSYPITLPEAIAMTGLNVFSKYLPGKMWMVMGKSLYISEKYGYPPTTISLHFLHIQFMVIWCGLILGLLGLLLHNSLHALGLIGLLLFIVFTVLIFSNRAHKYTNYLLKKKFKKNIFYPWLSFYTTGCLLPWFILCWLFWGGGFYFLSISLTDSFVPFSMIFCFPLAATFGILSVFTPGGIGVREGIMTFYMSLSYMNLEEAITISAASRVWFLIGELFIFFLGYIMNRKSKI